MVVDSGTSSVEGLLERFHDVDVKQELASGLTASNKNARASPLSPQPCPVVMVASRPPQKKRKESSKNTTETLV